LPKLVTVNASTGDVLIGRLIDGRYQVNQRIARGGMATVYLATDLRLERRVAVKVMHSHLADDSAFTSRFIQEARSAARLAHPNVVSVFDQGQDSDIAYLIMEYLPGITLRDLLKDYGKLTAEQTVDIMDSVLKGLAAAHESGIIHRDLKPENVLLADDGRIKIGDFGLARATTAHTASGQALLGTIAYLSPELLTRGTADARSDIYALGIMMYEMLTGEQPFTGDQPMQVAYQHAHNDVPRPSILNPNVPPELDELVVWATQRTPAERPASASTLLDALITAERALKRPTEATGLTTQQTVVMPAGESPRTDATRVLTGSVRQVGTETDAVVTPACQRRDTQEARDLAHHRHDCTWLRWAAGLGWFFTAGPGALETIPAVAGMNPAEAKSTIEDAGFIVKSGQANSSTVPAGLVAGTDPTEGSLVQRGSTITVLVSLGPKMLPVPTLVGIPEAEAKTLVTSAGFKVGTTSNLFSAEIAKGTVIRALGTDGTDLGSTYADGANITLVVSAGPVPDVVGKTIEEATATLSWRRSHCWCEH
jgi:eukaryotic-like serine/threonine-protein kinase